MPRGANFPHLKVREKDSSKQAPSLLRLSPPAIQARSIQLPRHVSLSYRAYPSNHL
ncbi:hypothetical protein HMPREF9134_00198 [Porphyromonas catoniae F0037]|uniref:Uncharacterized protein n=1 Tax=Porphyromonas catoniae F0037 TaxID=1127696 RepID=L1NII8_9PORP|nr:hypothetical protein HMPREF9134_00198 [Porphyromonas catoniae F0037]